MQTYHIRRVISSALIILLLADTAFSIDCFECNLWMRNKGGNNCDKPYISSGCKYCARHYTYVRTGFSQNAKRVTNITTLICVKSRLAYNTGCRQVDSSNGYNIRCACDSDFCNAAASMTPASLTTALLTSFAVASVARALL